MEMESEELLYDDQNTEEEEVEHDLAGVDVDGLLGDDDQSMAGQSDVDPANVEGEGEEVFDEAYEEEATEYADEDECQEDAEFIEENNEENAEESMDQEQEQEQTKQPANEDSVGTPSNVCFLIYYLIKYLIFKLPPRILLLHIL